MRRYCPLCKGPWVDPKEEALSTLGLGGWDREEVTPEVVKKAYRNIAKTCHPDSGGDREKFEAISTAKDTLTKKPSLELVDQEVVKEALVDIFKDVKEWSKGEQCPICGKG